MSLETVPARLAIDAMSGDHGIAVAVPAALRVLAEHPELHLILVGDKGALANSLRQRGASESARLQIESASQVVGMDESPAQALRGKRDSSMRVAINLVKSGRVSACVSAGNTGALMATSRYVLKSLSGIDRPAICSAIPAQGGPIYMLDLGANADCSASHLVQFAAMGAALASAVGGIVNPRLGLLNIGAEEIKGNERVKEAARILSSSGLNYFGYVEGHDIATGKVDVVVTDGFTGNVALKTMEGTARFISTILRQEFSRDPLSRLGAMAALPTLNRLRRRLDPQRYNGASFLGLRGIVVKSHGSADEVGFATAIRAALLEVEQAVPDRISRLLEEATTGGCAA